MNHQKNEGFAEFYAAARDGCLQAVRAAVGDPVQAEELTAEAFARALVHWRKIQHHPAPRAWVVRVALNTHVSWWRKRRREVQWPGGGPEQDRVASAESELDGPALTALRTLPRRQREVVALRVILDLDTYATAEALGISPSTVAVHYSRATAALRTALADPEERMTP